MITPTIFLLATPLKYILHDGLITLFFAPEHISSSIYSTKSSLKVDVQGLLSISSLIINYKYFVTCILSFPQVGFITLSCSFPILPFLCLLVLLLIITSFSFLGLDKFCLNFESFYDSSSPLSLEQCFPTLNSVSQHSLYWGIKEKIKR